MSARLERREVQRGVRASGNPWWRLFSAFGVLVAGLVACLVPGAAHGQPQGLETMLKYCDHVDSVAAPTREGIQERTDCWKRIQLQGLSNALIDARYRAAVDAYDAVVRADSVRRELDAREAQVTQWLITAQRALARRDLDAADSSLSQVLAVQSDHPRALALHDRVMALRHGARLRTLLNVAAAVVLVVGLVLAFAARIGSARRARQRETERLRDAQRTAMVRIIDGVGRGKMYTLHGSVFRIGSAQSTRAEEQNDLVLSDAAAFVSRYHCVLVRKDGQWFLIDSSLNGTSLNDERIERGEPRLMEDGSEFTLSGVTRLKFMLV